MCTKRLKPIGYDCLQLLTETQCYSSLFQISLLCLAQHSTKKCHETTEQSAHGLFEKIAAGEVSDVGESDEDGGNALEKEHAHDVPIDELYLENMSKINSAKNDNILGNVKNNI